MGNIGDTLDKYLGKTFGFIGKIFKIIKLIFIVIIVGLLTYGCYKIFGYLFYITFFLCMPVFLLLFEKILDVPSRHVLECRIGSEKNKKEDRLGLLKIPLKKFEKMDKEGGNISTIDSVSGKPVSLVEEVKENKIIRSWVDKVRSINFYGNKEAFAELQEWFMSVFRDVIRLQKNWVIYNAMEIKETFDDIAHKTNIEELDKFRKKEVEEDGNK